MARTPIDKKIALLLAKAESTTPEEAQALTEAAERLMVKHGIEQAMIDARRKEHDGPAEKIVERTVTFREPQCVGLRAMASAVAQASRTVRVLRSGNGKHWESVHLIGYESDVDQMERLINSLHIQAKVALAAWWREFLPGAGQALSRHERFFAKREFIGSFGMGAASRIRRATAETVRETTGSEIALRDRSAEVDEALREMYPSLGRGRALKGSLYGRSEGYRAGQQANTGERAVGGHRALS